MESRKDISIEQIQSLVQKDLSKLKPHLRDWVEKHLIEPRIVSFSVDSEGKNKKDLWLLTDHVGVQDSSYRVVFDKEAMCFGLEMTLQDGVEWYMGPYEGGFVDIVENM